MWYRKRRDTCAVVEKTNGYYRYTVYRADQVMTVGYEETLSRAKLVALAILG